MRFSHVAGAASMAVLCVLICGCGDIFRPVATPLPQPSADPQSFRLAVFTSCSYDANAKTCSASGAAGAATDVDVSGDSVSGVTQVGRSPVFALVESVQVATADRDNDTVTTYNRTNLGTSLSISSPVTTVLPAGAQPVSLANANGVIYVAESGRGVVGVLGSSPVALQNEIPVGLHPVNLAALPSGKKVYVVNQGDNTVSVISTADGNVLTTFSVGTSPAWAVASSDSLHVYVVNQGTNNVSVIDATTDAVTNTIAVGTYPNYAVFDAHNQRILVTNPGSNSVSVITADSTSPAFLQVKNISVGTSPVSVTALADGSRVYVANRDSHSVSVINSLSLTVTKTISLVSSVSTLDQTPSPVWISSDQESLKVLTANRDAQDLSMINTSTDSEVTNSVTGLPVRLAAPQVDPNCVSTASSSCTRLSPVFVAVGPG